MVEFVLFHVESLPASDEHRFHFFFGLPFLTLPQVFDLIERNIQLNRFSIDLRLILIHYFPNLMPILACQLIASLGNDPTA